VVVGGALTPIPGYQAFRWTFEEGLEGLGHLPDGFYSEAYGVSPDNSVIVGRVSTPSIQQAFRWTSSAGAEPTRRSAGQRAVEWKDLDLPTQHSQNHGCEWGWNGRSCDLGEGGF
jgi:uncharacterized membrane protein